MCLHVSPYLPSSSRLPSLRPLRGLCSSCSRPAISTLLAVLNTFTLLAVLNTSTLLREYHQLDCHDHFINSIFSDVVPALFDSGFTNPHGLLAQLLTVSVLSRNHSVILRSLVSACLLSSQTFALVVVHFVTITSSSSTSRWRVTRVPISSPVSPPPHHRLVHVFLRGSLRGP